MCSWSTRRDPRGSVGTLTLADAIAQAGGITPRADINSITVYRGGWRCPKVFRLARCDLYMYGADIQLKPGDRIAVGTSDAAQFEDALGPGIRLVSVTSSLLSLALSAVALANSN